MSQMTSQIKPIEPVVRKAACQPHFAVTKATSGGAMKNDAFAPELKMPVAKARSSEGNHSVVALIAAGKFPASPMPSIKRAMQKPATEKTKAWPMDEQAQTPMARA